MKYPVLSKTVGWIILVGLVILDASLDRIFIQGRGLQNHIFKPIANLFGITNPVFLTPIVFILFYVVIKVGAWLSKKIDKIPIKTEELVLTTLVIVYGIFDLWLISVYFFDFNLLPNHFYLVPFLIIAGIAYEWWAGNKLKKIKAVRK